MTEMDLNRICLGCMAEKQSGEQTCPACGYVEGTAAPSPLFLKPGTVLKGRYLVGRVLGCGGFGITYLAFDLNLEGKLAIKEYFPSGMVTRGGADPAVSIYSGENQDNFEYGLEKFIDEARTLLKFEDVPEIVSVKDFFKENGTAYLVMNYVEGITLKQYLERQGGKLPPDAVLTYMLPVMKALEQVHQTGILHRDISPDNIFVTKNYTVKLLDFGAARYAMGEHSKSLSVLMKPGYTPEEQYRTHGNQGPWTDVYAVAATMYKLLTGKTPPEALDRMNRDELEPLASFGVEVPFYFEAALKKALSIRAADRFQTMAQFEQALTGSVPAAQTEVPSPQNVQTVFTPDFHMPQNDETTSWPAQKPAGVSLTGFSSRQKLYCVIGAAVAMAIFYKIVWNVGGNPFGSNILVVLDIISSFAMIGATILFGRSYGLVMSVVPVFELLCFTPFFTNYSNSVIYFIFLVLSNMICCVYTSFCLQFASGRNIQEIIQQEKGLAVALPAGLVLYVAIVAALSNVTIYILGSIFIVAFGFIGYLICKNLRQRSGQVKNMPSVAAAAAGVLVYFFDPTIFAWFHSGSFGHLFLTVLGMGISFALLFAAISIFSGKESTRI